MVSRFRGIDDSICTSSGPVLINSVRAPIVFKSHITLLLFQLYQEMSDCIMSKNEINVFKEAAIDCARAVELNRYTMPIEKLSFDVPKTG